MIYLGSNEILRIKLGNTDISAIYAGDLLIYPTTVTGWSVNPTSFEVKKIQGSVNIRITSLSAWTITSNESWVTFSQNSGGSGRTTVIASYETNTATTERYATIIASDGTNTTTVSLTQKGNTDLPSIAFLCNYNAKLYDPTTRTIPKVQGQIFDQDLVLNGNPVSYTNSSITVNGQYFDYNFNNNANNPFNRSGSDSLTIVMKAKPSSLTSGAHSIFSNRGGSYNWMVFNPANGSPAGMFFLHTANGAYANAPYVQAVSLTDPNIFAFRVANGSGYGQSYTDNETFRSTGITWGGITNVIHILGGVAAVEAWNGEFYWMYISTEALTDNEIQQVIDYNENL